ncbi:MAG: alpha/beta fold hydrolase [Patescibacteria group bacterium]
MNKRQVVVIHGGDTFGTYNEYVAYLKSMAVDLARIMQKDWRDSLQGKLGEEYQVILPKMRNHNNAKYSEWKIYFDKVASLLDDGVVLIGHSLGGIFLAKYLSENKFPKVVKATILVAPPFDDSDSAYDLADFDLPTSLERLQKQGGKIFLYCSKDDPYGLFKDFEKYKKALPNVAVRVFENRGHFNQPEFPELIEDIKSL